MGARASRRGVLGALLGVGLFVGASAPAGRAAAQGKPKTTPVAIVVNAKNDAKDPTLDELKKILLLEQQFWANGKRVTLFMRPSGTVEKDVLLDKVYKLSADELKKHWTSAVFAGRLPAVPTVTRTSEATLASVKQNEGAISAVVSSDVTEGVRVLAIDGKRPGDADYPLVKVEGS